MGLDSNPWMRTARLDVLALQPSHLADARVLDEDPRVMRFINGGRPPEPVGYDERFLARVDASRASHPLGIFALHEREGPMVGLVMLKRDRRFVDDVEVGWRLRPESWGLGYATEAARALVDFAFEELKLRRLISHSLTRNVRSQAVMLRLGFSPVITFTYDSELLPSWNAEERLGRLCVLNRDAWEVQSRSRFERGVVHALHHVQLAMIPGGEDAARAFYGDVLGLPERAKPESLAKSGGLWFEAGNARVHLGLEPAFVASQKAHPALLVENLEALFARASAAGFEPLRDARLPGVVRGYLRDPFGNRLELMEAVRNATEERTG